MKMLILIFHYQVLLEAGLFGPIAYYCNNIIFNRLFLKYL